MRTWTLEEENKLIELYKIEKSTRKLAEIMNKSVSSVQGKLRMLSDKGIIKRQSKSEASITSRGVYIEQYDYFTGEYIGDYESIVEAATDNGVSPMTINKAFRRSKDGNVARVTRYELEFRKKVCCE